MTTKKKTSSQKQSWKRYFDKLDTSWTRIALIGAIFIAGFWIGQYYKETIMIQSENAKERQSLIELKAMIDLWNEKEHSYREEINQLKHDNQILQIKLETYEQNKK